MSKYGINKMNVNNSYFFLKCMLMVGVNLDMCLLCCILLSFLEVILIVLDVSVKDILE